MTDDARAQMREHLNRHAKRAIARIRENRPDLRDRNPEETVAILKDKERRARRSSYDTDD